MASARLAAQGPAQGGLGGQRGTDVFTTVNIQHLESLNDKIFELTGVRVRETFPDRLLHQADSVVLIDLPPRALRERIAQGRVYATEKISTALANFFRTENLTALRALALREVAEEQEADQPRGGAGRAPAVAERVLVCIDGRPNSEGLVRRAARAAHRSAPTAACTSCTSSPTPGRWQPTASTSSSSPTPARTENLAAGELD